MTWVVVDDRSELEKGLVRYWAGQKWVGLQSKAETFDRKGSANKVLNRLKQLNKVGRNSVTARNPVGVEGRKLVTSCSP